MRVVLLVGVMVVMVSVMSPRVVRLEDVEGVAEPHRVGHLSLVKSLER